MERVNRLQQCFERIANTSMRDMPLCNPALSVDTLGFRPWEERCIGILLTPWCINLILLPGEEDQWPESLQGQKLMLALPSGNYEFIHSYDAELGGYAACSLFSPVFEFASQAVAIETAEEVMVSLFDERNQLHSERQQLKQAINDIPDANEQADEPQPAAKETLSRRGFITAGFSRGEVQSGS